MDLRLTMDFLTHLYMISRTATFAYTLPHLRCSRQSFPKHYSTGCWMLSRRLLLPTIWHRILPQKTFYRSSFQSYLENQYRNYMNSDSVFRLSVNNTGAYHGTTDSVDLFPVHAFTGFLLFLSSLVGLLVYLKDQDDHIYDRVSKRKRLRFCLTGILANITPVWLISVVTLYLYEQPEAILPFLLKMSGYVLLCLLFAFICLLIFRHYKPFVSALPVLVICTLIFSPIFLHLEDYAPILRYLSYLFPPTFFRKKTKISLPVTLYDATDKLIFYYYKIICVKSESHLYEFLAFFVDDSAGCCCFCNLLFDHRYIGDKGLLYGRLRLRHILYSLC